MKNNELNLPIIISRLNRLQKKYLNNSLRDKGLEDSQGTILYKIKMEGSLTPKELTEMGIVEKSAVSKILRKLEIGGYIKKEISDEDARSYSVSLTESGLILSGYIEELIQELNALYEKTLSQEVVGELRNLLTRMEKGY